MTRSGVRDLLGAAGMFGCLCLSALVPTPVGAAPAVRADAPVAASGGARVAFPLPPGLDASEHAALQRSGAYGRRPVRLLILGDSIALTLGMGLSVHSQAEYGVTVSDHATIGCDLDPSLEVFVAGSPGPSTQGCDNWRGLWPFLTAAERPQVVALGLGRWEVTDHLLNGQWVHVGEPAWDAHLTADFRAAISIFHTFGARVVLFTMPYIDPNDRQSDGLPWSENTPASVQAYNALVHQVARSDPRQVSVIDLNRMLSPHGVYTASLDGVDVRLPDGIHISQAGGELLQRADPARDRSHRHGGRDGGKGPGVTGHEPPEAPAAELVVESVPAAMSLAPNAVGPNLGAELLLDPEARPGVESMRTGLLQASPLAAAGVLANGASVVLTVALARLLTPHSYGVLNQLTGLYLILSMPGSAVVVAVVRRVTLWHEDGSGHLVRRWAGRVHRQGTMLVLIWAVIVFVSRHGVAVVLNQQSGIGIAAILTAAAFFVLLSLDRGLLQAHRAYRPLGVNLLVEMGVRLAAVLVLVLAGYGPSGAAVGILIGEVVAVAHARYAAVRAWSGGQGPRVWVAGGWVAAVRPDPVLDGGAMVRRTVVLDLVVASVSLSMVAVLQNVDVLVVGRDNPTHSGAYAAVSVTSKAIVFGAIVLGGYLLPEAAIRWRQGGHALRQLAVVLVLLAVPSVLLLGVALAAPEELLQVVFHHDYTSAADALAPLVLAMILLSVSVVLTMYLLAVGRRWVAAVLVGGAAALTTAVLEVHGAPRATALVDLGVQAVLLLVIVTGFALVHRRVGVGQQAAGLT